MGVIYNLGMFGQAKDLEKSLHFYERAAAENDGDALHALGEVYEYGRLGQEKDPEKSLHFYGRAAAENDADTL